MIEIHSPRDVFAIIKRRKMYIFLPLIVGILISLAAAQMWPAVYRSSSTILVEEPDVTTDFVDPVASPRVDAKVPLLAQRIMTAATLLSIIEKHDLYPQMRKQEPVEKAIEAIRSNIYLEMLNADMVDPRSGRPTLATIAFTLAFDYGNPQKAQEVLTDLVSLYLAENKRTRHRRVTETKEFLDGEFERYQALLNELEDRISTFKSENAGRLPEQVALKMQMKDRAQQELLESRRQLQSLQEQRIYLQAELAQVARTVPPRSNPAPTDPAERLRVLQLEFASLRSRYSSEHPDVKNVAQEIQELRAQVGGNVDRAILEVERNVLLTELASLRQRYSDDHPDVIKLRNQIETLEGDLSKVPSFDPPENPAYIQLRARLDAVESQIRSYRGQKDALEQTIADIDNELLTGPEIEREYNKLLREYESTLSNLKGISEQRTQAELSETLETQQKTEQFILLEGPTLPIEPVAPNRLAILVLGVVASLIIAGSLTLFTEIMDHSVYGFAQLASITRAAPLVVVPHINTRFERARLWLLRTSYALALVVASLLALSLAQSYLPQLDTLWPGVLGYLDSFRSGPPPG